MIKLKIRLISIISYMLIMLSGEMIGIPFFLWLIYTCFDFGNIDQLFEILGVIGIALNFTKWKTHLLANIASFLFMLSPIASRMVQVPINMFHYAAFEIPLKVFVATYIYYTVLN